MANRSYLYSTNTIPELNQDDSSRVLTGISEYNYDIPIVFKVLLSGNPQACLSVIWDNPEKIALIGDYTSGVQNLEAFLASITLPAAQVPITEALEFLKMPENQNQYFILECGEIFEMSETPVEAQNLALFNQVQNLQPEIEAAYQSLLLPAPVVSEQPKPIGFWERLFGRRSTPPKALSANNPEQAIYDLGLGLWSNILYFDFSEDEDQD
ncbi:hypothetical protein I6E61_04665 [Psychrobacter sp. NZS113]|uniref:DUF7822 domain-containing protein n=1 Tax=Psychrobacter sp. NZS113 TaxID=2792045 RepID=UPI0018CFEC89|nr:hypothetical protein [Psychrobacter sp. NZS113]MBH0095676.1 hypothetical protein [Psychrobacter sp. NZS113]